MKILVLTSRFPYPLEKGDKLRIYNQIKQLEKKHEVTLIATNFSDVTEAHLNELKKYNPELLDKKRLLAITKSDLLDAELKEAIKKEVPKEIPSVFISSIANQGIMELKDLIWRNLKD